MFPAFIAISKYLFYKTEFAGWIYAFAGASMVMNLGESTRNIYLKSIFNRGDYYKIRLVENFLTALPFLLYLSVEKVFGIAAGLGLLSFLLAAATFRQRLPFAIPTPFKKFPFEFIAGFRKQAGLVAFAFFLDAKAIQVGNFNLGAFALGVLFFTSMSFYLQPEQGYFVWIYSSSRSRFLKNKITDALICVTILTAPILISLGIAFPDKGWILIGVQLLGCFFLTSMVLAKYSAFPREMSLPQAILFGLSLWFPPMLLALIPIFYNQSKKALQPYLQ